MLVQFISSVAIILANFTTECIGVISVPFSTMRSGALSAKWNLKLCGLAQDSRHLFNQMAIVAGIDISHIAANCMAKATPALTVFLAVKI